MPGAAGRPAEVLRAGGGVGVEVGTAGHAWQSRTYIIYKDACSLAQEKGPASLIYHEPALEVRFVGRAAGTTSFLTIGHLESATYITRKSEERLVGNQTFLFHIRQTRVPFSFEFMA
jgi:hypothetical protein